MLEDHARLLAALTEGLTKTTELTSKLAEDVLRHRAWEAILYLLVARYYMDKDDPIGLAMADRDFLANAYREHGKNENGAKLIEHIYKTITHVAQTGMQHLAETLGENSAEDFEYEN